MGGLLSPPDLYSQALTGAPQEKALYSNRSLAFLRMKEYHAALQDAQEVLKVGEPASQLGGKEGWASCCCCRAGAGLTAAE